MNGSIKLLSRKEYPWMYDNEHDNYSYGFFVKNKLVGRLRITHIKDEDLCSISEFLINESYRGKGIGKQLLKYIINKYGNHDMVLNVAADNTIAKDLYFNNGFRITYTNNTPELGEPFYVKSRPGRNIKGEIKNG